MRLKKPTLAAIIALAIALAGCGHPSNDPASATPASSVPQHASPPAPSAMVPTAGSAGRVVGMVVRFTAGTETVDLIIGEDSPATRDFLTMLPFTVTLEEFNGREKIADLPRELNYQGSPGSDPEDGDLIYYSNLGFYYNTAGIGQSEQTIHIGKYNATVEELARVEGQKTTIEIVDGP